MNRMLCSFACSVMLLIAPCEARDNPDPLSLFSKLRVGQTFRYQIVYRAATNTTTESTVAAPMAPHGGDTEAHLVLRGEVEDVRNEAGKTIARIRTQISEQDSAPSSTNSTSANPSEKSAQAEKAVDFVLHPDGQVTDLQGLDKLSAQAQSAWQEWVDRFAASGAFPQKSLKPGEKWKAEEPITTALLSGLSWEKESQYVNDSLCSEGSPATQSVPPTPAASAQSPETCAVILTTAIIKQRSPQKESTPEDYKLHDLRTFGVAKGKNEIFTYISLKTGLVVRATEDANQSLNVIVAKSDGSNRVHYQIDAESHAQILLLSDPATPQP